MNKISVLEKEDLELQLQEIEVKRRLNKLEREKIMKKELINTIEETHASSMIIPTVTQLHLHYSKSAIEGIPRIADVCPDGSIKIYGKKDSEIISKKYSIRSLLWIRSNLPKWGNKQRETIGFFRVLAERYSKRFVKISHITIESLCYLVDSGKADEWFDKYELLKSRQVTLEGGVL